MKKKKEILGIISCKDLIINAKGKTGRMNEGVKSGTGYHRSVKDYNRKSKNNQRLKNQLKNYGSEVAFIWVKAQKYLDGGYLNRTSLICYNNTKQNQLVDKMFIILLHAMGDQMNRKVDLHLHTYASDGEWSPAQVIENIDQHKIKIFAVTDHDEVGCIPYIVRLVKDRTDLTYIKGVEGTVTYRGIEHHILTYDIDESNEELLEMITFNRNVRYRSNDLLIDWLKKDYPHISSEDYKAYDYNPYQGGWRAYGYLFDKGVITDIHDYFQKVRGFEDRRVFLSPEVYLPKMKALGYKTVLAHPPAYTEGDLYDEKHLDYFRDLGLTGIECYSKYLKDQSQSKYYVDYCHQHNMVITGGSDCHGGFVGREIGFPDVDESMIRLW